jgi:cyanophycinase
MMRFAILTALVAMFSGLVGQPVRAEQPGAAGDAPQGSLVIIGGALRFENDAIWSKIGELAGGAGSRIAIFPTASSHPEESSQRVTRRLAQLEIQSYTVPLAVRNSQDNAFPTNYREQAFDPAVIAEVRRCNGIYFTGGSQARITEALFTADQKPTPLLEAVWDVYRRGGVIAGTSAGAAMMSETMFAHPPSGTLKALLADQLAEGKELARGLGFLGANWFVDQHCLVRGRFARSVRAMMSAQIPYGIGVDEDTAVVVRRQQELEVIGYKGAILMDCSDATRDADEARFNARNVKLSYLDHGDKLNLKTLAIETPAPKEKSKIDPQSPTFQPGSSRRLFTADVLGNTTVIELMSELLTNRHGEAVGLAFDAALAGTPAGKDEATEVSGFEFRLYREKDTCGWYSDERGCDGYTIANVRLDVQPVYVQRAIYSKSSRSKPEVPVTPTEPPSEAARPAEIAAKTAEPAAPSTAEPSQVATAAPMSATAETAPASTTEEPVKAQE